MVAGVDLIHYSTTADTIGRIERRLMAKESSVNYHKHEL